jgi:3-hydroxyacyl-[acyl-carrier-protein] dehydratase
MRSTGPRLVAEPVTLVRHDETGIVTQVRVEPAESLFAGHYPDFPIFPGVALVECAHRGVLLAARLRGRRVRLSSVDSAHFRRPVRPGGVIISRLTIEEVDGADWLCSGVLEDGNDRVANLKLRYRAEEES